MHFKDTIWNDGSRIIIQIGTWSRIVNQNFGAGSRIFWFISEGSRFANILIQIGTFECVSTMVVLCKSVVAMVLLVYLLHFV